MTEDDLRRALVEWPKRALVQLAAQLDRQAEAVRRRIRQIEGDPLGRHNAEQDLRGMSDAERAAHFRRLAGPPVPPETPVDE